MAKRARLGRSYRRGKETLTVTVNLYDDSDRETATSFDGMTFTVDDTDFISVETVEDGELLLTASLTQTALWSAPTQLIPLYVESSASGERVELFTLEIPTK
jgi:hypothetical protein